MSVFVNRDNNPKPWTPGNQTAKIVLRRNPELIAQVLELKRQAMENASLTGSLERSDKGLTFA